MKYIGAIIIFITCTLFGFYSGQKERGKVKQCSAFLELFEYVKNQVSYFLAPTKLIYRGFENKILEGIGFTDALYSHESDEIYFNTWETAFKECESRLLLNKAQKDIVLAFGSCIGKSNEQLQINSFDYYIKAMTAELQKQKIETDKNVKLYRTLGMTAGAMLAIIVL